MALLVIILHGVEVVVLRMPALAVSWHRAAGVRTRPGPEISTGASIRGTGGRAAAGIASTGATGAVRRIVSRGVGSRGGAWGPWVTHSVCVTFNERILLL